VSDPKKYDKNYSNPNSLLWFQSYEITSKKSYSSKALQEYHELALINVFNLNFILLTIFNKIIQYLVTLAP
jgi:hypothetical protein